MGAVAPNSYLAELTFDLVSEGDDPGDSTQYIVRYRIRELADVGITGSVLTVTFTKSALIESSGDSDVSTSRLEQAAKMFLSGGVEAAIVSIALGEE